MFRDTFVSYSNGVNARNSIDDFEIPWPDFRTFFLSRGDAESTFLIELDHENSQRREWSVAEWQRAVLATSEWLQSRNVGTGGVVATLIGNRAEALLVAYACWMIGACCVPLNPADSLGRHTYILEDSAATLFIYGLAAGPLVDSLDLEGIASVRCEDVPASGAADFGDGFNASPITDPAGLDVPALRVYTSGTTGNPKGVVLTSRNLLTDCDALISRLQWPTDTRVITVLPVHHVNGLVVSSLLPWLAGFSTILCDRFRSERFWTDVTNEGATVCSVVPSLLEFLLKSSETDTHGLREFICGAGPLLVETALEFEQKFEIPVRHLYGLSETTAVVTLMPVMPISERRRWHESYGWPSIGPALSHVEVTVHDADGVEVEEGTRGELVMRGAMIMSGYAGMENETRNSFRGGWFHSGDEGFWIQSDGDRFFFITGRLKELIIRGGSNISPLEVDSVLCSHSAVDFGLAISFENRFYGEEVAAYVVTNSIVSNEELLTYCARYLDYARQPKVIIQGDEIPYTATGKAKRIELKARLAPELAKYREKQFRRSKSPASLHVENHEESASLRSRTESPEATQKGAADD